MAQSRSFTPDAATGTIKLAASEALPRLGDAQIAEIVERILAQGATDARPQFGDKVAVAEMAGGNRPFCKRWVDDQMALGMPHLKLGARRVRFDLAEVAAWLKEKYGQQRRAPACPSAKSVKSWEKEAA